MREGKIGYDELQRIIDAYGYKNRGMIMGPSIGVDCSVFDLGKKLLVATSDPVTFVSSGYYCINVNVNDVVSMGAKPFFFMATIILPPESRENELEKIMQEIQSGCRKFRVNFAGGHTETSSIVNRPLISGFMVGTCRKDELRGSFNAKDGDMVLITKGIGIEGTAIIAEKRERLIEKRFGKKFLKTCLSHRSELSVYKEAVMARKSANGMHDATEGGIINALYEMCVASGVSMDIDRFPVSTETRRLCDLFGIEPLGLISSGTLVITTKDVELAGRLEEKGIRAYEVGRVVKDGKNEVRHGGRTMKTFVRDEIARI
jgi:hydrogenase maturation factor